MYLYGGDIHRTKWTEIIFAHYQNIRKMFNEKANITFTILGSEKELSKELTLKYFNEDEYHEYDQNDPKFNNQFWEMLKNKINTGINIAAKTNSDIIFQAGSNDYISSDFFKQVIDEYNQDKKQIYGIDNFQNGQNVNLYNIYDGKTNSFDDNDFFWWSGEHFTPRNCFHYTGGIVGLNKKTYKSHPEILSMWNHDEGEIEQYVLSFEDVHKFNSKQIFWMNTKTKSSTELNTYDHLRHLYMNENLLLDENSISYMDKIKNEIECVKKIITDISFMSVNYTDDKS